MANNDAPIPKTFEELFVIYSNYNLNPLDVYNDINESILLTQIDFWLKKAELLKTVFSITDTGMAWMKFKKWRLDYDNFVEFLNDLCSKKKLDFVEIKEKLIEAGTPTVEADRPVAVIYCNILLNEH